MVDLNQPESSVGVLDVEIEIDLEYIQGYQNLKSGFKEMQIIDRDNCDFKAYNK